LLDDELFGELHRRLREPAEAVAVEVEEVGVVDDEAIPEGGVQK
jgi:hypothetical protein